ncbi:MAG: hypothetical protein ACTSV5_03690 [Promethearchaeota archaeon]
MKSNKNDISPIVFFFDVITTDVFKIPVIPTPMRIDKVIHGDPTLFILPDFKKLNELGEKLDFYIDFESFFKVGIENLISFTKIKYNKTNYRPLKKEIIRKWFNKSQIIKADIPDLSEAFTFIISEFLMLYSNIEKKKLTPDSESYRLQLIQYCERLITYFREKIEQNDFQINVNGEKKIVQLYREKKNKYFPQIISIDIFNIRNNSTKKMAFVPYLIYDDLLDCFTYNRNTLTEEQKKANYINLHDLNRIIKKKANIFDCNNKFVFYDLKLNEY